MIRSARPKSDSNTLSPLIPLDPIHTFSWGPRTTTTTELSNSDGHLDGLLDAVCLGRVDLLAGLCDLGQDSIVGQAGDDLGALVLERDLVALDA